MPLQWHNQSWKNLEEGCRRVRPGVCRWPQLVLVVKGLLSTLSLIFCCICRFQNKSCVTVINMLPSTSALKAPSPELFVEKKKKKWGGGGGGGGVQKEKKEKELVLISKE